MKSVDLEFFNGDYITWRDSRFKRIVGYYGEEFFKDKTMLEVGCAYGDLGNMFSNIGVRVTCSEGVPEYVEVIKQKYPHLNAYCQDLNLGLGTSEKFDIILHTGVLYHLETYEQPIRDACASCTYLILETEVADSIDDHYAIKTSEYGPDQSLTMSGIRPSPSAIERVLTECGFSYERIRDGLNSWPIHQYDWLSINDGKWADGKRAFWFCKKL